MDPDILDNAVQSKSFARSRPKHCSKINSHETKPSMDYWRSFNQDLFERPQLLWIRRELLHHCLLGKVPGKLGPGQSGAQLSAPKQWTVGPRTIEPRGQICLNHYCDTRGWCLLGPSYSFTGIKSSKKKKRDISFSHKKK